MKTQLFVRQDIGTGDPLVLLHGMFGDGSQWDLIAQILSKDFRVIVVDLLGHGRSPRPKGAQYTDKEHAAALRNTLETLKATEHLTVVGYSMGGAVALSYSSIYPDGIDQLYLISTPFYLKPSEMVPNKYAGSILFTKISTGIFGVIDKWMHRGGTADKVVDFSNKSAKFHAMIGANDNVLDTDIIRLNIKNLVSEFDFVGHLKNIKVPFTFYAGKKDVFVVQPQLNALRQYQPFMDIQRLDVIKIDHMLVQNLPREISQLIKKNGSKLLHVEMDEGKGSPLVMLHGIESSSSYWKPFLRPLSEQHRLVTIDLLGFGKSPKPLNIAYSLDDHVLHLAETLNALNIKKMDIIAHSLGSLVAVAYAAKYPERVSSLTLLAPVFVPTGKVAEFSSIAQRLELLEKLSDNSRAYARTAAALGYQKMSKYLPSFRSIRNSVQYQDALGNAEKAEDIPTRIIYGEKDSLIDKPFLYAVASHFNDVSVMELPGQRHNFALFDPEETLKDITPNKTYKTPTDKATKIPPSFGKQILRLAIPVLVTKSLLYSAVGLLLFTDYAAAVITIGVGVYFFSLGHAYIQGAFSLKHEKISYFWYIMLGIAIIAFGLFVVMNPQYALEISSIVLFGLVLLAGIARLIVGLAWAQPKGTKTTLLVTGSLLTIAGLLALGGGAISIMLITYGAGVVLLVRGVQFGMYAIIATGFAYIRGFERH